MLQKIKNAFYRKFKTSFAKSGMDLQLYQMFKQKSYGFYVDVGSHHPILTSNTFFFYLRKWEGICIDPNPEFVKLYKEKRPNDTFLNIGISNSSEHEMNYYKLKSELSERNSFSKEYIETNNLTDYVREIIPIKIKPLSKVLSEINIPDTGIDFLTVDCEGLDLEVLMSNDWNRFRPKIVITETYDFLKEDLYSPLVKYMESLGYILTGKTIQGQFVGILVFVDNSYERDS